MSVRPRIVVAGLGPGGDEHVTAETLSVIERIPHRYLRTSRHPSAHLVPDPVTFDEVYEQADTFADVYAEITDRLVRRGRARRGALRRAGVAARARAISARGARRRSRRVRAVAGDV